MSTSTLTPQSSLISESTTDSITQESTTFSMSTLSESASGVDPSTTFSQSTAASSSPVDSSSTTASSQIETSSISSSVSEILSSSSESIPAETTSRSSSHQNGQTTNEQSTDSSSSTGASTSSIVLTIASTSSTTPPHPSMTSREEITLTDATTIVAETSAVSTANGAVFTTVVHSTQVVPAGATIQASPLGNLEIHAARTNTVGAIVGGTLGGIAVITLVGTLIFCFLRRRLPRRGAATKFDGNFEPAAISTAEKNARGIPTLPSVYPSFSQDSLASPRVQFADAPSQRISSSHGSPHYTKAHLSNNGARDGLDPSATHTRPSPLSQSANGNFYEHFEV